MLYGTWPVRWETGRRGNRTHRYRERLRGVEGAGGKLKAQIPWLCLSVGRRGDRLV